MSESSAQSETTKLFATSCLHLVGTISETEERFHEELRDIPIGSRIVLLGDIIDPVQDWEKADRRLSNALSAYEVTFVPGNNDWWQSWMKKSLLSEKHYYQQKPIPDVALLEGGNYGSLPWSHHHDTLTREQEGQHAQLMAITAGDAHILMSHFPFFSNQVAKEIWKDSLDMTKIEHLVFGHLHQEYFSSLPRTFMGRTVQLVSDHDVQVLHEIHPVS